MSYLGYPRITFAGRFQADPSTINNSDIHFDDDRFVARYQLLGPMPKYGGWNPRGTGSWRVRGCDVKSVRGADGRTTADPASGAQVAQADDRVSAKLVDLDPDDQMVSTVFGLRLALRLPDGTAAFAGDFEPAPFTDIWARHPVARPGMRDFGAVYQSVIDVDEWGDLTASPLLQQLRETTAENRLSIKFNVDGYEYDVTQPNFTWGRIVGTIGPYVAGEPHHFAPVRILSAANSFAQAPVACRIDPATATVSVDLGNSLRTTVPGGALADAGVLRLVALPSGGDPVVLANTGSGQAYYDSLYEKDAGIVGASLSPEQLDAAQKSPLALLAADGTQMVAEDTAGRYLRADQFVFRMSPGDTTPVRILATTFGQPTPGVPVTTEIDPQNSGQPLTALTPPATAPTGADGWVELDLEASDPGNPRGYIDGQVYAVAYGWAGDTSPAGPEELTVLVWNAYEESTDPTWVADVQPILQQYANLYPIMRDVVDLGDYSDVALRHTRALQLAMGLPETDPNYMPVTRDLSPAKRSMILKWLAQPSPPVFRIDDVTSLRQVLQLAIELEHATIPPYLCALFSIVPGQNQEVAELIKSVVMQEMLHMALVCNLLNAVGGQPRISSPAFVPKYPGHLPGGVRPDLTVSLRKCSIEQVRDVFMAIEAPSEPVDVPDDVPAYVDMRGVDVDPGGVVTDDARATEAADQLALRFTRVEHEPLTIGWSTSRSARRSSSSATGSTPAARRTR